MLGSEPTVTHGGGQGGVQVQGGPCPGEVTETVTETWVQCDACDKWRQLPIGTQASGRGIWPSFQETYWRLIL